MKTHTAETWESVCRILIIVSIVFTFRLDAEWKHLNGPYGGFTRAMMTVGSRVYAGTDAGVFFSTDSGAHWIGTGTGLNGYPVHKLAALGSRIFAYVPTQGIFASADSGAHWTAIGDSLPAGTISALTVNDRTLYVAMMSGLYRSDDTGRSWPKMDLGENGNYSYRIAAKGGWIVDVASKIGCSFDNGATWKWNAYPSIRGANAVAITGTNIVIGTEDGTVTSNDSAATWIKTGLEKKNVSELYSYGDTLFAGTDKGIFLSEDNGMTWVKCDSGIISPRGLSFTALGKKIFAGMSGGGVYASTDGARSWSPSMTDLSGVYVQCLITDKNRIYAGSGGTGLSVSDDQGKHWTSLNTGMTGNSVRSIVFHGTQFYTATDSGVFCSSDSGRTWRSASTGLTNLSVTDLAITDTMQFAGTENGMFRSSNSGETWQSLNDSLQDVTIENMAIVGNRIFCGTYSSGAYQFVNDNHYWKWLSPNGVYGRVEAYAVSGSTLFSAGFGIFRTTDYGEHWEEFQHGVWTLSLAAKGRNIFAGTWKGVQVSTDNGSTWTAAGLDNEMIIAIGCDDTYLYAATGQHGLWARPLSEIVTSVAGHPSASPEHFGLQQNYPNPFNPSTTISFSLPSKSFVSLKIYDVMGREVATIASEELSAGLHEYRWNAEGRSSGVYFCRLVSGTMNETKKLILQK